MSERRDVIRTKTSIRTAYFDLLFEKPREKITVRDVLNRSGFSHGTFYSHFRDIVDLHEQLERHIVSECLRELRRTQEAQPEPCLALFEARREQLRALRSAYGEPGVIAWLKGLICTALVQSMGALSSRAAPAVCRCISGALVDACVDWVLDPGGLEREAFLRIVTAFLTGGIQSQTAMT